jgi:hypothetical protein
VLVAILMTLKKFLKLILGLLLIFAVAIGLTSIKHPIVLKWLSGTARIIGKPVDATVYTNGKVNHEIKIFHTNKYWGSSKKANNYIISLKESDTLSKLKFFNINLNEKWVGRPVSTANDDYDLIWGNLVQSETGGQFIPFQDDIKGFDFDPQLLFNDKQIKFNVPPNTLKFDSVRVELN